MHFEHSEHSVQEDDLKNEDNLKNEDDLKNEDKWVHTVSLIH